MRAGHRLHALLMVCVLVAAACGGGDDDDTTAPTRPTDDTDATGPADTSLLQGGEPTIGPDGRLVPGECAEGEPTDSDPDHGVFADRINVASVNVDFSALVAIGFARDQGDTAQQFAEFFEIVNEQGGVCGRMLDYETVDFNILAGEGPQACLQVTDDRRNLVVLGQEGFQEVSCIAEDGDTVLVTQNNASESTVAAAGGRMFVNPPSWNSQYEFTARRFHADGLLDGKVGVFYGGSNPAEGDIAEESLLPVLDELGVDYVAARTDGLVSDETGSAAARAAATTFLNQGVDTVFMAVQVSNHAGFILEATTQGLDPVWLSAPAGGNTATTLFMENAGVVDVSDGELLTSYQDVSPEFRTDAADACNAIWNERTGESHEPGSFIYAGIGNVCAQVDMLVAALTWASPELTQESVTAALENLPPFGVGRYIGEVRYGPGDRFGGSQLVVMGFDSGCVCFRPEGDPVDIG